MTLLARHAAAPAAIALLSCLLATGAAATPGEPASIYQAPFIVNPPFVSMTPDQLSQAVSGIVDFPKVLDPRIWTPDFHMRPQIASRVMAIVNREYDALKLRNKAISIQDIELFGSNASYEYDEKADLGIHVFLNTSSNPAAYQGDVLDLEHFMRLLNDVIELDQKGEVSFYGIPLEVVFHATRTAGYRDSDGIPQYSVWSADASRTGRWINPQTPPPAPPKDAFDAKVILAKTNDFIDQYNSLVANYFEDKASFDCSRFDAYKKVIKTYRSDGISADGQRSNGNLTYRLLRRLSVNVPDTAAVLEQECLNIRDSLF
jgi:hypothetical protein